MHIYIQISNAYLYSDLKFTFIFRFQMHIYIQISNAHLYSDYPAPISQEISEKEISVMNGDSKIKIEKSQFVSEVHCLFKFEIHCSYLRFF